MKKVYSAANLPDAHLLSHMLDDAGIEHHIFNENLQGGVGELPFTHTYPEIWIVRESDFERARQVISLFERPDDSSDETVKCAACGEENPGSFEICWQCGKPLKRG